MTLLQSDYLGRVVSITTTKLNEKETNMQLNLSTELMDDLFKYKSDEQCYKKFMIQLIKEGLDSRQIVEKLTELGFSQDYIIKHLGTHIYTKLTN